MAVVGGSLRCYQFFAAAGVCAVEGSTAHNKAAAASGSVYLF
jgi:hypothetical protein